MSHTNVSDKQVLHAYLGEHYNAYLVDYLEPFIVIFCDGGPPPENMRPFSIAGMIAVWKEPEYMSFEGRFGSCANGEPVEIDPEILGQIRVRQMLPEEVILYLASYVFKDCEALTLLWETLVVELPKTSREDFPDRLETLPDWINGCPIWVQYYNGPLPNTERRRHAVAPEPKFEDGVIDDTDYIKLNGKFYPGTMISSANKKGERLFSVTAGVLVEKGDEKRLTCSFHCWDKHHEKYPDEFGQSHPESQRIYQVLQGEPGTRAGYLLERMTPTDIGLAKT